MPANHPFHWLTTTLDCEGSPLALRVRPDIDKPEISVPFPHLGIVSQRLDRVGETGMPEPSYNQQLPPFDAAVHESLELRGGGHVMLVETFQGKRYYYACVRDEDAMRNWADDLWAAHPGQDLDLEFNARKAWGFYRRYRGDSNW